MPDELCDCGHAKHKKRCPVRIGREHIPGKPESRNQCKCDMDAERDQPRLCETSKEGHLVAVKVWPPKQRYRARQKDTPWVSGLCDQCGAHVIVYDPPQPGLRVKLPDGRVITADTITGAKKAS